MTFGVAALKEKAVEGFQQTFDKATPTACGVAPGRAEVIGNHTDYNEGYILACAVDRYVCMVGKIVDGTQGQVASADFEGVVSFDTREPKKEDGHMQTSWANYVMGVVDELNKLPGITVSGFDAFVTSDVPPGSGVSSSAALEMATAKLLQALFPNTVGELDDITVIKACKAAENNFVGMGCGVLDQFSSGMGRENELVFLDCRDFSYNYAPFKGACFILANTKAKHALVDGQYDKLRTACFESASAFAKVLNGKRITHLRDVTVEEFEEHKNELTHDQSRRAEHIVYENKRTQDSFNALQNGDVARLGEAMSESHNSSRDKFGNSCKELDIMRKMAEGITGFLGGRLMGGGFGGCTINLVKEEFSDAFCEELTEKYRAETGIDADMIRVMPGNGAVSLQL